MAIQSTADSFDPMEAKLQDILRPIRPSKKFVQTVRQRIHFSPSVKLADKSPQTRHFLLVSALGANPGSSLFYNRVKGMLEMDVRALGFPCFSIFQPSFLVGERAETRKGEAIGIRLTSLIAPLLRGPLSASHPVAGADVAAAMVAVAQQEGAAGTRIYRYRDIQALLA